MLLARSEGTSHFSGWSEARLHFPSLESAVRVPVGIDCLRSIHTMLNVSACGLALGKRVVVWDSYPPTESE